MERLFRLREHGTDVRTEVTAGITTFMTMAYILAVNPGILADAGMDPGAVFTATCLSSILATVCMAFFANYPFVLAPGMGLNAYFAYTVVLGMGYPWQTALAAVFIEGVLFILLSLTRVREGIFNAIPAALKHAVSAGIGLFIAFIGLQNCKLVVDAPTLVGVYTWEAASFRTEGITVLLAVVGVLLTGILVARRVKGHILWGILLTWGLGILCQLTGLYVPDPAVGALSLLPDFSGGLQVPSMAPTFLQLDFSGLLDPEFLAVVFALLFVDIFDTLGGLIGISSRGGMLDGAGKLPRLKGALLADAVGTAAGALCGTSTVTTYAESAAGVAEGGRTGLTALVAAGLFGVALFLSPIFLAIPAFATAPALIVVGFLMAASLLKLDFEDPAQAIPAFLCAVGIPFFYSISEGIALGVIAFVAVNLCCGREKRKNISPVMAVLAGLFLLKYIAL